MKLPNFANESTRAYVYRILTCIVPITISYGVVDGKNAALWVALIMSVLGTGLAAANTSTGVK